MAQANPEAMAPAPEGLTVKRHRDLEGRDECRQLCALRDLSNETLDPDQVAPVISLLDSSRASIRDLAIRMLAESRHAQFVDRLPTLLTDPSAAVRVAACDAAVPFLSDSQ